MNQRFIEPSSLLAGTLRVSYGQCSDKGSKASNQDYLAIREPKNALRQTKGIALALADGVSSSQFSHIASELAVTSFLDDYYCTSETWTVATSAKRVIRAINSWLYAQTMRSDFRYDREKGYACTFSAVIVKNRTAHIFHIGDCRVYRINKKGIEQLTNDHRFWANSKESYLSRVLGTEAECPIDYQSLSIEAGDVFLLLTDGVYDFLQIKDMVDIVQQHKNNPEQAAKKLVDEAYKNKSDDNLSAQIIIIDELPLSSSLPLHEKTHELSFAPELRANESFDGYKIQRLLYRSNRSLVYLALEEESQRKVVLKFPGIDIRQSEDALERFLLEEWIAKKIYSAHVLGVASRNTPKCFIYTSFEFIDGQTLAQWIVDNPKPNVTETRDLIIQIAKGVQAFHRMEMLHQDLRPENIMIDQQGTVKIIDFGAVKVAGLQETLTEAPLTELQGTALYSAPEYFLGEPGSQRSDIFSLGVIIYYMLSGEYPFGNQVARCKNLKALQKLHYKSLRLNESIEIPAWIDFAIEKATHPRPEKRYETLSEFIHDLRKPATEFLRKEKAPLIERNPIAFWQGLSAVLFLALLFVINQTHCT